MKPLQQNALRLALYQPDIPANTGAMMRLCACMAMRLDIIEPCGFPFDDKKLKRTVMDYAKHVDYMRHLSWTHFKEHIGTRRIVLLTTKTDLAYYDFAFRPDDVLMVGRESAGVPEDIHQSVDAQITIPMAEGVRSLNVGMAAAIVVSEALRQIQALPALEKKFA